MTIHVVQRGENLFGIARRYGTTPAELVFANQLQAPEILSVGQALVIPVERVIHTVQRGQSVYSIARLYGVSAAAILAANPAVGSGGRIYPGQTLVIPFPNENLGTVIVNGYITDTSEATLRATLPYMTFLSPFSFRADETGVLTPTFSVSTAVSESYSTANLLTVTNLKAEGGFSSAIAHAIFTDQEVQDNLIENLLSLLDSGGWYGVNLDFEYVYPYDRQSYNQFLRRLTDLLHARGYLVVTALAPKLSDDQMGLLYSAHDYAFHGAAADYVVLMTYEWGCLAHWLKLLKRNNLRDNIC